MLMIGDVLVSDDVIEQQFICNLDACKGACCWEGDIGAPLEEKECEILDDIYDEIKPYLLPEGIEVIEKEGKHTYDKKNGHATPLIDKGACVYMIYDNDGVAKCGIEQAYREGVIDFKKPISCHLYPIRVLKSEHTDMEALNYDKWEICSAACELGALHQVAVYEFVKEAIIRKYGEEFYEELDAGVKHLKP